MWARLERPSALRLVAAARSELSRVVGFVGRADAPQVLADRLSRRLANQMRTAGPIKDPVGWLIGLALPQRQQCGDVRCSTPARSAPGARTGRPTTGRSAVAAKVDAAMPRASEAERRMATAQQLHQDVTAMA
ncbi:hypothetical protein [Streptomyces sp. NPDC056061]|uniref:hypothetical protein n=1 Tax=Streptomyces sp. NPDC056061 TaxID=3345700 RepID=UPI0035D5AE64